MMINDQIRDEKLQYDINREAAEMSALSLGKTDKYEYLTGKYILPSTQQQIIEPAKFTYFPLGKAFVEHIKTIENQGEKQVKALEDLKEKEQAKAIKGKSRNQSIATNIFNDLIEKRKGIMNELYQSVNKNKLYFEYVDNTKDVSFYEYMDSKELFDRIKNNRLRFDDALKNRKSYLKK